MKKERRSRALIDRFWPKVEKTDGCWLWIGAKDLDGYGFIKRKDGKQLRAHRFIFEYENNLSLLSNGYVMHSCDNPSCVNPKHLSLGDARENVRDMINKGRKRATDGERNGMFGKSWATRLSKEQNESIRGSKERTHVLAKRYNVTSSTIRRVRNSSWRT